MDDLSIWTLALADAYNDLSLMVVSFLPTLIVALLVLLIGILVAETLSKIVKIVVRKSNIDSLVESSGINGILKGTGFELNLAYFASWLVKWFIILIFLVAVADTLGLPQISDFINQVTLYIPNVIGAVVILVIGVAVASALSEVVRRGVSSTLASPSVAASITKWAVLVFVFMAVLAQLQIATRMIETLFAGIVAALVIAGGLAFGLGGKDKAKEIIDHLSRDFSKKE